jgi:POT family proton-dependent oligopeptide transporter
VQIKSGYHPSIVYQLLAYGLLMAGEIMVSITGLEFSYTQAPRNAKSLVMALYLFSVTVGNWLTSAVNFFIQNPDKTSKLSGASYYLFFAALMFATAVAFIFVARHYQPRTYLQGEEGTT